MFTTFKKLLLEIEDIKTERKQINPASPFFKISYSRKKLESTFSSLSPPNREKLFYLISIVLTFLWPHCIINLLGLDCTVICESSYQQISVLLVKWIQGK